MNRNSQLLDDFGAYCAEHPDERFWQALRNWSGHNFILAAKDKLSIWSTDDTFYWGSRDGK